MSTETALWKIIESLPSSLKIEILHYAEYLITKSSTLTQVEDVTVLETNTEQRENWQSFCFNNLNQCYAEYAIESIKEYNPNYERRQDHTNSYSSSKWRNKKPSYADFERNTKISRLFDMWD